MIYGKEDIKVGDYIRDRSSRQEYTVAAVFSDKSVITSGKDRKWLDPDEYKLLNSCKDGKHERDIRRFAYAMPNYMSHDDPRALSNRRKLENRGVTTADAKDVLEGEFEEFLDGVIKSVLKVARNGNIRCFKDVTDIISRSLESSDYIEYGPKTLEALYVSSGRFKHLRKEEKETIKNIVRRSISNRLTDKFREREGASIDLDRPNTIEDFLSNFEED